MSIKILTVITLFLQLSATAQVTASAAVLPFTSNSTTTDTAPSPVITEMKAVVEKEKIMLNWKVEENQAINLFEIEKSTDGRNYSTAALVFGSDKPMEDAYLYFEKAAGKKITFRIKMISKDKQVTYSTTVTAG